MRLTRTVAFFLLFVIPCVAYAQQAKNPKPTSQIMEGTVISVEGTKYWSGFKIESEGKEYTFATEYKAKQGTNPTVTGGKCCDIGKRVRVTYVGSLTLYLLNVTSVADLSPTTPNVSNLANSMSSGYGQDGQIVLRPNQLTTYSLAPGQEKVFVLQMKKGDFAGIESLAREGVNVTLGVYDPARKELLEEPIWGEDSLWFVAQTDGDFVFVITLNKESNTEIAGAQRISIQYNNKFKLPARTKQKDIRKINGYDVKIMSSQGNESGHSIVLIEKNGHLKKILKVSGYDPIGFSFPYPDYLTKADTAYMTKAAIAKEQRTISLIKSTIDKTGDGIPDVMIQFFSGGAHCCVSMYFINLGETVQTAEVLGMADAQDYLPVDKSPNGGLLFHTYDLWAYWNTSFAHSPPGKVILEFRNGKLRPNFDLMKKPAPSLTVLKNKAEFYRQKLSIARYKGAESTFQPPDFEDPFYKEGSYPNNADEKYKGAVYPNVVFWGPMLDLIYTGHEDLAWQFLDLAWPPQKPGKALFIRDFKKQLLESHYWKMILEDNGPLATARQQVKNGHDVEAIATLRQVLANEPTSAESYLLLGRIHLRSGKIDLAISYFKTCIFWDNRMIEAHL